MISFQDISVVVQGPISEYTEQTLQSVRKILPEAELILSTWKGSDIKNLEYDIAVLSNDPGGYEFCLDCGQLYNVNRLIVSTFEGIKRANKPYVLKLRSDMELHSSEFLNFFGFCPVKTEYSFLNQKILIGNIYTRNPHFSEKKILFHIGDFFYFGQKEDLLTIFDIRLATQNIASYFKIHEPFIEYNTKIFCKYFPEQFIWLSFVQKYHSVDLKHPFDSNKKLIELHDKILVSNTILIDLEKSGIDSLKYPFDTISKSDLYSHLDYLFLYNKICNNIIYFSSFLHYSSRKTVYLFKKLYHWQKFPERTIRNFMKQKFDLRKKKI
ncbi:MAG: WavE lipopolysaccharide synthesis family protein [Sulfuricurvum sp.]|nr:WavE lipopolysaccharide synthesis family protein [Sulfuricurvum sp.]MDD5385700.1 WavE lipopolysaccharide synthesis family protein [Sulfuricurvum sp.]